MLLRRVATKLHFFYLLLDGRMDEERRVLFTSKYDNSSFNLKCEYIISFKSSHSVTFYKGRCFSDAFVSHLLLSIHFHPPVLTQLLLVLSTRSTISRRLSTRRRLLPTRSSTTTTRILSTTTTNVCPTTTTKWRRWMLFIILWMLCCYYLLLLC